MDSISDCTGSTESAWQQTELFLFRGLVDADVGSAGLHNVEAIRSEFQRTAATLTKSISGTVAAVDNLEEKHDKLEEIVDDNFSLMHSKLDKLSRERNEQVSRLTPFLTTLFYSCVLIGSKDPTTRKCFLTQSWLQPTS